MKVFQHRPGEIVGCDPEAAGQEQMCQAPGACAQVKDVRGGRQEGQEGVGNLPFGLRREGARSCVVGRGTRVSA